LAGKAGILRSSINGVLKKGELDVSPPMKDEANERTHLPKVPMVEKPYDGPVAAVSEAREERLALTGVADGWLEGAGHGGSEGW
jgi:hypothetical protein